MTALVKEMKRAGADAMHHQSGMDRRIERRWPKWLKPLIVSVLVAGVVTVLFMLKPEPGRTLQLGSDRLIVSAVVSGQFEDFIPVRGRVTPSRTVYLDAIEGGRVDEVLIEDGAIVDAGQLLVRLSNSRLQLDVIAREAEITEQQNNLNTLELSLERNRLDHKRSLVEADYQITRLNRLIERRGKLAADRYVSGEELVSLKDELEYWQRNRDVRLEAQASDERLQRAQLVQIRSSVDQLQKNLEIARGNLDSLNVRAPVHGKLTAFDLEVGQSLSQGERLGQIDDPEQFKLAVEIDEFYLNRVDLEQQADINVDGKGYSLVIRKVYPQVRDGQFLVDMGFSAEQPERIRRGQTLQVKLFLGTPEAAVLIPNGAFYQDTGGEWVFVVSPDNAQAYRRNVRLGRRNARYIEVLDGLELGEQVVTSSYLNYLDVDRLELGS